MNEKWKFPGSKWWNFDFHTHSPASDDYGRDEVSFRQIGQEEWLRNAMKAELDCVVVSDHNSGGWVDQLKAKNKELQGLDSKPAWYRDLTIFPGVEITIADSSSRVHVLGVFDPDCDSQKVTGVLGACGITDGFGDDEKTSTRTGFIDTVNKITEAGGIAIPSHINGPKGLLEGITSLTPELEKSLNSVFAAEFCDPHEFEQSDPTFQKALGRLAVLAGSDAHKPNEIGQRFSWLKMSRPSIDGLRLALFDHEFCVINQVENPNHLPDIFLSTLTIQSMSLCGRITNRPLTMTLHPHLNTVIGGRGTGKSTILESIRIASRRDQNLESEAPKVKVDLDKFMKLSQKKGVMLEGTEILLDIHRRSKEYRLRWRFDGQGSVLEEKIDNLWQNVEPGDIKERFPLSIYSQKQINELALNPGGLLEIVDRSPDVNRNEWKGRWDSVKSRFLQLREQQRELLRQLSAEQQIRVKLQDVENDLKQYEEKGHGEILNLYQKRSQQKNGLPTDHIYDELFSGIRELANSAELSDFPSHLFDDQDETTAGIKSIHEQTAQELIKISTSLNTLAEKVGQLKMQRIKQIEESLWFVSVQSSIEAYSGLVKEYEEKKSHLSISLYGEWVQHRNQLHQQIHKLESVRKESESIQKQIEETLLKFLDLREELLEKRRRFIDKVIGGNAFVRMELIPFGDVSTLDEEYRELLNLDEGKFISSVWDRDNETGILRELIKWEELNTTESDLPDVISALKRKTADIGSGQNSGNHATFDNRLKKLFENQPSVFDQFEIWWPEDMLRVKYSKDSSKGKFEDLAEGSAGQKAAAILAFLLSHGSEPLVIDQPEDDLDNALIYDLIVAQIHENKTRRQLIIVTHNPNIVLNGDAELVHVLRFKNGQVQIEKQGGLEEIDIRNAICTIMEGGRKAFDKRYKRITLEF